MRVAVPTWMEDMKNRVRQLRQQRRVASMQKANRRLQADIGWLDGQITSDCQQLLAWQDELRRSETRLAEQRQLLNQLQSGGAH